jgi:hypothetical protein
MCAERVVDAPFGGYVVRHVAADWSPAPIEHPSLSGHHKEIQCTDCADVAES